MDVRRRVVHGITFGGVMPPAATLLTCLLLATTPVRATDLPEAEDLFRTGRYDECAKAAGEELRQSYRGEVWSQLKIRAEMARGEYEAALKSLEEGLRRFPASVELRLLGRDVYRFNGRDDAIADLSEEIERFVLAAPQRYASPEGRVALGRYFLTRGADARKVLDQFYDVARKQRPTYLDAYYATAELALDKEDDALAADTLKAVPQEAAQDPHYHCLLARAFAESDGARAEAEVAKALEINPRHADSLLLRVDHQIDAEQYDEAAKTLDQVLAVNPHEPRAWSYRAVLAHLKSDAKGEAAARDAALAHWKKNPEVDHLIGRKLSQKYRFTEGSAYQRQSLGFDADYRPAKIQLCQDLLRLGDEEEGWKLADEVVAEDGYNVLGYNLVTLRDHLSGFRTLRGDGFIVRMDAREAALYGPRVVALLGRARDVLCPKYGVALPEPVVVEVFPQQKDFAVRTFGMPGADGFLGVCFGRVITVNSPASQGGSPSNWESVVWHEFCHTVTLTKTRNKMPRWLSEGISVYEEGQRDPACATPLSPQFRKMLLGEDFTPLSKLSSAFLAPKSPAHLQFAYFESALAVEFLIERFGLPALTGLLDDLGAGVAMNDALAKRTETPLDKLDEDFARFARQRAESTAPDATFEESKLPPDADADALADWVASHPNDFPGLLRLGAKRIAERGWEKAREPLEKAKRLYPEYVAADSPYRLLATVYRNLGDAAAERGMLEEWSRRDGDAADAFSRLAELDEQAGDWRGVAENANRLLAVNPLVPAPHRLLARAAEELGRRDDAIAAYRALSALDETDPAALHFRLAKLLRESGKQDDALREVLKSLEEAPRFAEAHRLLLELAHARGPMPSAAPQVPVEAVKP
jgi:tetratricopeptide (TPR) repeat protein